MPASGSSARRYAQAVFESARERGSFENWEKDLTVLAQIVREPQFAALLKSPRLPLTAKRQVLQEALPEVTGEALNLATILTGKGRLEALIGPITREYGRLLDQYRGIVRVEVVTAIDLDPSEQDRITRELSEGSGKQIRMVHRVNPELIGGMLVRIGDRVVDGSVLGRLGSLRRSLAKALV